MIEEERALKTYKRTKEGSKLTQISKVKLQYAIVLNNSAG